MEKTSERNMEEYERAFRVVLLGRYKKIYLNTQNV